METDVGEFILQHLQKHWQKMVNCSEQYISIWYHLVAVNILLFAKDWSEPADLSTESSSDMLRCVRDKIFHRCHNVIKERGSVNKLTEAYIC